MVVDSHTILIQSIDREIQENNKVTIQLREQLEELLEDFNILVIENDELETCQRAVHNECDTCFSVGDRLLKIQESMKE
jgi:hypothetical protein